MVGLPRRSQEYMHRKQPAVVQGKTLHAGGAGAAEVPLGSTDIVIAFGDTEADIKAQIGEHSRVQLAEPPVRDRLEDLHGLLDDTAVEMEAGAARGHVAAAVHELRNALAQLDGAS